MTVRREMAEWGATRATCEPCPCQSRFSRQSRPSRLSQASAIAVEALMNNASSCQRSILFIELYVLDPLFRGIEGAYFRWPVYNSK
jgi:hypothetical protein